MRDRYKICLIAVSLGIVELGYMPDTTKQGFICKDPKISHPFVGNTVSSTALIVSVFGASLLVITIIELLREKSFKRACVGTAWTYYKECIFGATLVHVVTEITKVLVGGQRPHFFYTCEPDANRDCEPGTFILDYNCTNTRLSQYYKTDSIRSFPSGHASISVFVGLYLSYLVYMRIGSLYVSKFTKPLLMSVCLSWSLICSVTRITDRRHHWWDVLGGSIFGLFAVVCTVLVVHRREQQKVKKL